MEVELEVKKIGNSLGVIIPKRLAKNIGISSGEKIIIELKRKAPVNLFGILKGIKLDPERSKIFRDDEEW